MIKVLAVGLCGQLPAFSRAGASRGGARDEPRGVARLVIQAE